MKTVQPDTLDYRDLSFTSKVESSRKQTLLKLPQFYRSDSSLHASVESILGITSPTPLQRLESSHSIRDCLKSYYKVFQVQKEYLPQFEYLSLSETHLLQALSEGYSVLGRLTYHPHFGKVKGIVGILTEFDLVEGEVQIHTIYDFPEGVIVPISRVHDLWAVRRLSHLDVDLYLSLLQSQDFPTKNFEVKKIDFIPKKSQNHLGITPSKEVKKAKF